MQNKSIESNYVICARLSMERCQKYLAHLHALMYMCDPQDMGMDEIMSENARRIMGAINQELLLSARSLAQEEGGQASPKVAAQ